MAEHTTGQSVFLVEKRFDDGCCGMVFDEVQAVFATESDAQEYAKQLHGNTNDIYLVTQSTVR